MRRRKPDLMIVLATFIGLGVLLTSFSQGILKEASAQAPSEPTEVSTGR